MIRWQQAANNCAVEAVAAAAAAAAVAVSASAEASTTGLNIHPMASMHQALQGQEGGSCNVKKPIGAMSRTSVERAPLPLHHHRLSAAKKRLSIID